LESDSFSVLVKAIILELLVFKFLLAAACVFKRTFLSRAAMPPRGLQTAL